MKKWILNLGLTTLAVLPIVAIASCSSTTNEIPTLTTEVAKYKNPFTVKEASKTMTPEAVVASINKGSNTDKINALQNLVVLQLDNTNFTYTIGAASAGANNSVDVSIKITEKADASKSETVKLVISGFAKPAESLLDKEVARFTVSVAANETGKALKSTEVVTKVDAATGEAKLTYLKTITEVPDPTQGFTIQVLSAKVGTPETSVEVTIEVSETGTDNKANATLKITDFATLSAGEILVEQAKLLVNQPVVEGKKGETPAQAKVAISNENLAQYYTPITLSNGVTYEFASAELNATTNTTLDVTLTVKSNVQGVEDITKKVEITGFTSPQAEIEAEAAKIINKPVLETKKGETAAIAATAITNNTTLQDYYTEVALSAGFSYTWKSNKVIGDTVEVTVTVSSTKDGITPIDHTFIISGFKTATQVALDVEVQKFSTPKQTKNTTITTRHVITSINETATTQAFKETALKALVDFPTLDSGFTLTVGVATQATVNTSVDVALTITQTATKDEQTVKFTITGLTAETAQQEVTRLANTNLVDKVVLTDKANETAAQAGEAITNIETLAPYYALIPLPKAPAGLSYTFGSKLVEGDVVKVTISVSSTEDGVTAASKQFTISGFKTAALAELEEKANLLVPKQTKQTSHTAFQAKAAIVSDSTFTSYYPTTSLGNGYGYKYGGKSEVDKTTPTTLNVTIRVAKTGTNLSILKVVQITGFANPNELDTEALKFQTSLQAKTPNMLSVAAVVAINNSASTNTLKLEALQGLVTGFPEATSGYSLTIGRAEIDTATPTSINIPITVASTTEGSSLTPVTVTFTITGLTEGTTEEQLVIVKAFLNNRTVLDAKKTETAATAASTITNNTSLNLYYMNTALPTGFSYNYQGPTTVNESSNTTIDVTLRLSYKGTTEDIVVQISGFTAPVPTPEGN